MLIRWCDELEAVLFRGSGLLELLKGSLTCLVVALARHRVFW